MKEEELKEEEEEKKNLFPPSNSIKINYKNLKYNKKEKNKIGYKEIIKKLDYILEEQKRICPPTSYSNGSTNNIIMNSCEQFGQMIIIFSKFKNTFNHIYICENDENKIKNIKINLKEYNLEKYITFFHSNLIDYLKFDYLKFTPKTIILFNETSGGGGGGSGGSGGSDTDTYTNNTNDINEYLKFIKLNSIPLFFLNLKNKISKLNKKEEEEEEEIKKLNLNKIKNEKLNLIQYFENKSKVNIIQEEEEQQLKEENNNIISVQSNIQFKEIFKSKNLKDKLFKFLRTKLNYNLNLTKESFDLIQYLIKQNKKDKLIYNELFKLIQLKNKKEEKRIEIKEEKRKNYRVNEIEDVLKLKKINLNFDSMLDFGCADGEM